MKLLRLTSNDTNGLFESSLAQELIVGKQSQIALGSAALELEDQPLAITPANNRITYQVLNGFLRDVRLTPAVYNSANAQVFFNDIMQKLNEGIGQVAGVVRNGRNALEIGSATEIGVQYQVQRNGGGHIEIEAARSLSRSNYQALLDNSPIKPMGVPAAGGGNADAVTQTTGNSVTIYNGDALELPITNFKATTCQTYPMTKGCGVHRARIRTLLRPANVVGPNPAPVGRGFALSVHAVSPLTYMHSRDVALADIRFGIVCDSVFDEPGGGAQAGTGGGPINAGNSVYRAIINGQYVEPPANVGAGRIIPQGGTTQTTNGNDVVSIEILAGTIRGVVYQTGGANNMPFVRVLFEEAYDSALDLFGSYTFFGGGEQRRNAAGNFTPNGIFGCRLDQVRYTADPYQERVAGALGAAGGVLALGALHVDDPAATLGASTPLPQSQSSSTHIINFQTETIADWLGFADRTLRAVAPSPVFTAELIFKSHLRNDCFLLEMLNLPVDSYDFIESKRKRVNLLSVIPFDDSGGKVIYDPSHLIFLDINNREELRLRDIRCRLVRSDYSSVHLQGLSSLVIYIKDKAEQV